MKKVSVGIYLDILCVNISQWKNDKFIAVFSIIPDISKNIYFDWEKI